MRIKEHLILRKVGSQYMVVDPGTGVVDMTYVYAFNKTAAWLWEQLKGCEFTYATIVTMLQSNYGLSTEMAETDARSFCSVLEESGLLEEGENTP